MFKMTDYMKTKILGTGLTGLVGSRIVEILSSKYEFFNLGRGVDVDITKRDNVLRAVENSDATIVFHAAAFTDVKAAEKEKDLGEKSLSWQINVEGTKNIVTACEQSGKKLIHVSTDMVLGGDNPPEGGRKEDSKYNPLSWYAITKAEGEKIVLQSKAVWIIMRTAYPYRATFEKTDFVRFFIAWLRDGKKINALTDRIVTPTFIDDLSGALDVLIRKNATGIFHTAGSQALSIYDCAVMIAEVFGLDKNLIGKTTRAEFLVGRPPEPFSSALNSDKIVELGVRMRGFRAGLLEMKRQMGA